MNLEKWKEKAGTLRERVIEVASDMKEGGTEIYHKGVYRKLLIDVGSAYTSREKWLDLASKYGRTPASDEEDGTIMDLVLINHPKIDVSEDQRSLLEEFVVAYLPLAAELKEHNDTIKEGIDSTPRPNRFEHGYNGLKSAGSVGKKILDLQGEYQTKLYELSETA